MITEFLADYHRLLLVPVALLLGGTGLMRGAVAIANEVEEKSLPRTILLAVGGTALAAFWGPVVGVALWGATALSMRHFSVPHELSFTYLGQLTPLLVAGGLVSFAVPAIAIPSALANTSSDCWRTSWSAAVFARSLVYPLYLTVGTFFMMLMGAEDYGVGSGVSGVAFTHEFLNLGVPEELHGLAELMLVHLATNGLFTSGFVAMIVRDG